MAQQEPIRKRPGPPSGPSSTREIPDKLYFRIGEVARLCDVPAYVLRFWETEFPQLKPNKGGTGQRLFRRRDVEMALRIKSLLYDEGYTIPGARQAFKSELRATRDLQLPASDDAASTPAETSPEPALTRPRRDPVDPRLLKALHRDLRDLHTLLSRPAAAKPAPHPIRAPRPTPTPKSPTPFPTRPQLLQPARPTSDFLFDDLLPDPDPDLPA